MSLEKVKYDNGLSVYIDHMPHTKVTAVNAFVPYGSVHEQPGEEGAAHALEHAVFLQTPDFPDTKSFTVYGQKSGMYHNASTSYTHTLFDTLGLSPDSAFHQLSQILLHTQLPKKAVVNEMKAVRREAVTDLDDDDELHEVAHDYAMFGLPFGRSVIGHHDRLRFDAAALQNIYKTRYELGSMALLAVGAATPDDVRQLVERYFALDSPSQTQPIPQPLQPKPRDARISGLVQRDTSSLRMAVGYPLPPDAVQSIVDNPTLYGVACSVMSGQCLEILRNEKGISYDGGVEISNYNHRDAWAIRGTVTTDAEHRATANDVFATIFGRAAVNYTEDTIKAGIGMGKLEIFSGLGSVSRRMDDYCEQLDHGVEPIDKDTVVEAIERITIDDVRAAIDELVAIAQTQPRFEHRSGKRRAIGKVDEIISLSTIA